MVRHRGCTPELTKAVCEVIAAGNHDSTAYTAVGLPGRTHWYWMKRGREDDAGEVDSAYARYFREVTLARAQAEAVMVQVVRVASARSWQAAAWWLERKYPEKWALRYYQNASAKEAKEEIVKLLKEGLITPEEVQATVGEELAYELFERAGISLAGEGQTQEAGGRAADTGKQ